MKILKKIEFLLNIAIVVAIIFKMLKIQFTGIFLVTSMSSLAIIYWINAFASFKLWKVSKAVSFLNFSFYFFGSFLICAILYLIQFWPGGGAIICQSLKIYLFISLFAIIFSFFKYKENKFILWNNTKTSFLKYSILLIIGFILWQLPNEMRIKLFAIDPNNARIAIESFNE